MKFLRLRLVCAALFAIASEGEARQIATNQPITWVFLNTGAARDKLKGMTKEAASQMQSQHTGNFGTQFNRGTLIAAGPLGDNGFIRGTVILAVQTPEQIADCFKTDPFVQNKILEVESHPWLVNDNKEIPLSGLIGLQIHGGGKAEGSYKDISLEELP